MTKRWERDISVLKTTLYGVLCAVAAHKKTWLPTVFCVAGMTMENARNRRRAPDKSGHGADRIRPRGGKIRNGAPRFAAPPNEKGRCGNFRTAFALFTSGANRLRSSISDINDISDAGHSACRVRSVSGTPPSRAGRWDNSCWPASRCRFSLPARKAHRRRSRRSIRSC